jgi:HEPN domain-containing protein
MGSFLAFFFLFGIARNNCVAARVCLQNGMVQTGCLLAHQSVEMFAKGIMRLEPENYYFAKKDDPAQQGKICVWGHDLIKLMQKSATHSPSMNDILNNDRIKGFLEKLTQGYNPMRYGELSFNVKNDVVIQCLDELASSLDKTYLEKIRAKEETPLFVHDSFREDFLRNNEAFTAEKITNNPLSVQAMPGVKPPSFPS